MPSLLKNVFVGVSAFAVGLLYFFALALSVTIVWNGVARWYIIVAAWAIISAVLYEEKEYAQIVNTIRGTGRGHAPHPAPPG